MALPPQQFCVRWNSYHTNLQAVFPRLLLTEQFADVTLACESRQLRCHKLVLSACSAYLERLLLQNPCKHPIVLMRDMRFSEMQALVDFMYKGEVNVTQEELPSLLKSAEALQIRGLCSSDNAGLSSELGPSGDGKDFTVASDALVANAHRDTAANGPGQKAASNGGGAPAASANGPRKRKSSDRERNPDVKEETVEEDGLYYGELENDNMEYNEDEESGKPGSSLGQTSGRGRPYIRVKPESELLFQERLQNLAKVNSDYVHRLSKMNAAEIQSEFSKYGLNTNSATDDTCAQKSAENDYYKSWLEQNGELEVSLLKANQAKKSRAEVKSHKSEVELIPKPRAERAERAQMRRRGRPPIFRERNVDIGDTVLKSDLDQFLEGKEVSSSGLSRKDLERVMMGKFNPNRRYSNEAMWAALMDVKKGGSIYRAAQTHKVPRKSLRNWMKRCHIKSSFPMPQQLKQFVENSKRQRERGPEEAGFEPELDFGKHFLSFAAAQPSSEDEGAAAKGAAIDMSLRD
ncbi:unnamed protein product, partial [Iphiclides podalirius]